MPETPDYLLNIQRSAAADDQKYAIQRALAQNNSSGLASAIPTARTPRPLERIAAEADHVNRLSCLVQEFIDRFHGTAPEPTAPGTQGLMVSYRDEIDRLSANVEMLGARIQALVEIG